MFNFDHAIALWVFGRLNSDQLPDIAANALAVGIESPSLITVACANKEPAPELHSLFKKALIELGYTPLSQQEAGRILAREIAGKICSGELSPIEGAKAIWQITLDCRELVSEFGIFSGRASEYDDLPQLRNSISEMIISEARHVVSPESKQKEYAKQRGHSTLSIDGEGKSR